MLKRRVGERNLLVFIIYVRIVKKHTVAVRINRSRIKNNNNTCIELCDNIDHSIIKLHLSPDNRAPIQTRIKEEGDTEHFCFDTTPLSSGQTTKV